MRDTRDAARAGGLFFVRDKPRALRSATSWCGEPDWPSRGALRAEVFAAASDGTPILVSGQSTRTLSPKATTPTLPTTVTMAKHDIGMPPSSPRKIPPRLLFPHGSKDFS